MCVGGGGQLSFTNYKQTVTIAANIINLRFFFNILLLLLHGYLLLL